MMIELMQMTPFQNLSVLDMGSGTGILAILAKKMGAAEVDAIDIEEWAYENMKENALRNDVIINSFLSDVKEIQGKSNYYNLIFANINKNILLEDMPFYDAALKPGGVLFLSGFFDSDKSDLLESNALKLYDCIDQREKDKWCALKLVKKFL
jgi:ribosomal protein L11 methyltransferase